MRTMLVPVMLLGLVGCADYSLETDGTMNAAPEDDQGSDVPIGTLRFDVIPPDALRDANLAESDADFLGAGALPQSFRISPGSPNLTLRLEPAADVSGLLSGYLVTPTSLADLPGESTAIAGARVSIRREGALESANVITGADGRFSLRVPPGTGYSAVFLPESADVPFLAQSLDIPAGGLFDLSVDLGAGAAIWGRVTNTDGAPVAGVSVHAEQGGVRGSDVRSDARGWYSLRVRPGAAYTIVAEGREGGLDPSLRSEEVAVDSGGITVPFTYRRFAQTAFHGRIVDDHGRGVANAVAVLEAASLTDYGAQASYSTTVETSENGNFTTLVVPGTYTMEVLPPPGSDLSASRLTDLVVGSDLFELGTRPLDGLHLVTGVATDPDGQPVAGAVVSAEEIAFEGRSWSATTDAQGEYTLSLPSNPIDWTLTPPADRDDLALTRIGGDQPDQTRPVLPFQEGIVVDGRVAFAAAGGDEPVALAVVEARDNIGRRWGLALTDADGGFSMRVAVPAD